LILPDILSLGLTAGGMERGALKAVSWQGMQNLITFTKLG